MPFKTDGRPKFPLTSEGIRSDKIGRSRLNSSWQDINLEISGVVAPIHNEFESELSRCQTRQRFDREGNWRKWLCNPAIVLARSSSPREQGSLPGMADSAAFICPRSLLAFPCRAQSLQSSARGVLGIQTFSSLGRGRNGVVKAAGSIPSGDCGRDASRTEQAWCSTHQTSPVLGAWARGRNKDGGCSWGSNPTWRAPQPSSTPHKSWVWSRVWSKACDHILGDISSSASLRKTPWSYLPSLDHRITELFG